ncbi:MAG: shikimate dehydrogenase [Dehalococcoidia bacterium]
MTQHIALLGHPVAHSISPRFQQAALDALGIDARYEAWDVPPADLAIALERLRSADWLGANVTVPHKEAVVRLVDRLDPIAERVGAINTVVRRDGRLHATNTDVTGILAALEDVPLRDAQVVLLGAGGAARAVVVAMHQAGVARLTIANRTLNRARALAALAPGVEVTACPLDATDRDLEASVIAAGVVIQSTSVGMLHGPDEASIPIPPAWFRSGQTAFDLVYNPERTPFLRAAEAAGARPLGGLAMLVHQGAEAFRLWTAAEPPLEVMFAAARAAMAERATT